MFVWYHLSTILSQRRILRLAGLLTLCVAFITMLFFSTVAHAAPGINQTISFQGRLLTSGGTPVPNGFYNIQFKIYQDGAGTTVGNPGGQLKWTETYVNNGAEQGIKVTNGYMSVNLGSNTPFGNSIDWNQDTLWLSMNIAGLSASCSTFNTGTCTADGEMVPMKRLTATPYAINSGMLGGKTADGFIQNGTTQQTGNFNLSGFGRANILQGTLGIESPSIDRGDAGLLSIGSVHATAISIGSSTGLQTIDIGTGDGDKVLTIGSTSNTSQLTLQGGTEGVYVGTAGGFKVHTAATDKDTLVIGSDGSTSINLSEETDFVINNDQNQSVFQVGSNGSIQTGAGSNLAVNGSARFNQGIQVGDGTASGDATLFTLDRGDAAPTATGDAILGSMYYDTTLGKVQCYEADGWGACSSSPDTFVSMSPEFSNTVTNGSGIGTLNSDICSDTLNLNNGTNGQPTVCGTNETFNFYDWTSPESTAQTKSLYVTYQLPSTFKEFVEGSTSLMARTNSTNSGVTYEIFKNTATGLVACGTSITASTGNQTSWQKATAVTDQTTTNDPASCNFEAGQSIVFKVNFTASNNAHAYVSNLTFAYSSK